MVAMYKYLIIESKKDFQLDQALIVSLFSEFITFSSIDVFNHSMDMYFEHETDISFEDVIVNMSSDTLLDLRIFVSLSFQSPDERKEHILQTKSLLAQVPFNKYIYLDHRVLLSYFINQITAHQRIYFLRKYSHDSMMLESLRVYLNSNQNTVSASKKLYLHRNTLLQRLEKFHQITGFDLKMFNDAYLIYHLL
jgi:sugar diacid utilization regulator